MASEGEKSGSNAGDKDPWSRETRDKFESKSKSEYLDPCQEAATRSIRCLNRNAGDRAMCQDYFTAYRECKKNWVNRRRDERRKEGSFVL